MRVPGVSGLPRRWRACPPPVADESGCGHHCPARACENRLASEPVSIIFENEDIMVRFEDLRIFVSAADHGSFSAAARELDLTPAVASAALKRLELTLETRLFVRSTRSLRLTADGERYLEYARSAIATLDAGRNALARDKTAISGTLSISVPRTWGATCCCPGWMNSSAAIPASASRCASATGWPICSASRWTSRCATARPPTPAWLRCPCPNPTAAWCARRRPIWRVTARRRRPPTCAATTACPSCWASRCTTAGPSSATACPRPCR